MQSSDGAISIPLQCHLEEKQMCADSAALGALMGNVAALRCLL